MPERKARQLLNLQLAILGQSYHDGLPIATIDLLLESLGFRPMEPAIYCGREGRVVEQVGTNTWLCLSWHRMEVSGRYEVVAYAS